MLLFRKMGSLNFIFLKRVVLCFVIAGTVASVLSYWFSGKTTEKSLTEQMLHREQLVSRAGAKAIENYITSMGTSLVILGNHLQAETFDEDSEIVKKSLSFFWNSYSETPIASILYVDEIGDIKYLYQNGGFVEGEEMNVSDRQYFSLAKEIKGEGYVVGVPIVPRIGIYSDRYLIPIASPINIDGEFRGVIVATSDISKITEMYLNDLRISEKSNIYLLGDQGVVLSAHTSNLYGQNIFDFSDEQTFPQKQFLVDAVKKDLENNYQKKEGKLDYYRNDFNSKSNKNRYLTAYNIIRLEKVPGSSGERYGWILAVETPVSDAFLFTSPFFGNQFHMLLIFIFVTLGIIFLGILTAKVQEKEGYSKGFLRGSCKEC